MIVKIFDPSATFKGVSYNTNKIENEKGELMKVENFGALQGLENLRPQDYINYLEARSATSARIKYPQFHAVISCRGKTHSKEQLTGLATDWLKGMGYEKQPYLLVFHKDTSNNHIHIVSTRIGENGKKINDSYEKIRAYQVLNQLMGLNEKKQIEKDIAKALSYNFSTRAQFMMLLECQGYSMQLNGDNYKISKYGVQQGTVDLAIVDGRRKTYNKDTSRLAQLRAIIEKYRKTHNPAVVPVSKPLPKGMIAKPTGYTSELAVHLAEKLGLQILFHGQSGMPPYGYTVIDHSHKQQSVYKGGEIMPIEKLIDPSEFLSNTAQEIKPSAIAETDQNIGGYILGQSDLTSCPANESETMTFLPEINLELADDIDDEAILGRNRQRKRKARTNTR
jgi:Relaxase/Mobilisation nuclease domain